MITKEVINNIFKKYPRRVKSVEQLDIPLLFGSVGEMHDLTIDDDMSHLVIGSLEPKSIFHKIRLDHIHAFVPFEEWTAIVLPISIIFLNKRDKTVAVHIKPHKPSFWDKITGKC